MLPVDPSGEIYDCLFYIFPCVAKSVIGLDVELGFVVAAFLGSAEVVDASDIFFQTGEGVLRHLLRRGGLDAIVQP